MKFCANTYFDDH